MQNNFNSLPPELKEKVVAALGKLYDANPETAMLKVEEVITELKRKYENRQ